MPQKYIQPIGNRVMVKPLVKKLSEIIITPDTVQNAPQDGVIVALGTGGKDAKGEEITFEVAVGDEVIVPQYGGTPVKIDGNEYKIYRADELFAVIRTKE